MFDNFLEGFILQKKTQKKTHFNFQIEKIFSRQDSGGHIYEMIRICNKIILKNVITCFALKTEKKLPIDNHRRNKNRQCHDKKDKQTNRQNKSQNSEN